jgi:1-carboxybiuret hydrolase
MMTADETARAVRSGKITATTCVEAALDAVSQRNGALNAFTAVVRDRAVAKARAVDAAIGRGDDPGPLAGVPFAVKNLFDVEGLPTLAGSAINRSRAVALQDAVLISRLEAAGGVLIGTLNMGEYAYDFTGENQHYGASRNPLDPARMTGGSSGGSAGAVAGGLVPISLGSDTNGSLRVPASLCGIFSLKPTYGRLPRTGAFPFVAGLDHMGGFARGVTDLALCYDAMQGHDDGDAACNPRPAEPVAHALEDHSGGSWKVGRLDGYFTDGATGEALRGLDIVANALSARDRIWLELAPAARASAYLITTTEAAALHLDRLRTRSDAFEPIVRDRLISGAMVPASIVTRAQKVRALFRDELLAHFKKFDALIALATPCTAPLIGQQMLDLGGRSVPLRANIGLYTQPVSLAGFPVVTVPVPLSPLPIGVQIITAPWREDLALAIARRLELTGVCRARVAEQLTSSGQGSRL